MSCGKPHETDCSEVLERLAFFVDHELAQADTDTIQHHLDECWPCLEKLALEQRMKAMVARCCVEQPPADLRDRVRVRIREVHISITQEP